MLIIMKASHSKLLFLLLVFVACAREESDVDVYDLQTEYCTNPLGIDSDRPRFSWKLLDKRGTKGQQQTAYRILVASNTFLLEQNHADVWDSKKVESNQSALIPFGGEKLVSGMQYYWKVQVYDVDKKRSRWSDIAHFSMGLLNAEDWTVPWITHPDAPDEKHIWYRNNIHLDGLLPSAFIYVASLGYHELYVNGEKVDDRILAPALTRLDKRVHYVTYDIHTMLKPGKNTIALWYGPGWSRYDAGPLQKKFGIPQALRIQLTAHSDDGNIVTLDANWRCKISSSENTGACRSGGSGDMGGEKIDARLYIPDWNATSFDDSRWPIAKEVAVNVQLSAQMMEPTRVIEPIAAKDISGNGPYLVDMGKNFTGWIEIKMDGQSSGDVVTIKIANRTGVVQDYGQANTYICAGGQDIFRNRFNYFGGRYITIEGLKEKPDISDIKGFEIATDLNRIGYFSSSDTLFNQIYETDLRTFRANTIEGYTADCPHRERLGYGEEVFATAWGIGLPNYRSAAFYNKTVRDWRDVQQEDGWINHTAPQINKHFGGPMWSSAGLNLSWEYYQTFGDKQILEQSYHSSKRWLEFLASHVLDGLLQPYHESWGRFLGDWAAPNERNERGDSPEALFFNNCVYAMNLTTFIKIADVLGNSKDVEHYSQHLSRLKQRIHEHFFDKEQNVYLQGRQVHQAFPLLLNLVPDSIELAVITNFKKEITWTRPYLDMGSAGLPVLLKYLIEDVELINILSDLLSKTTEPGYGYFISRGETTWPEQWHADTPSRIHTCYTGIASYFIKSLGGIRPDPNYPGYQSFLIKPGVVGDLKYVKTSTESIYGLIESNWERTDDVFHLDITIPVNSTAIVYIPANNAENVRESGNNIQHIKGVKLLKTEENCTVLKVNSGKWKFSSKL